MKAFLKVADAKKDEDPRLETWVMQVRDVSFEIEDVIDEFLLWIADSERPHKTCLGSISSYFKKWKTKHQIGSELQSINAKVNDIAGRPKKYGYDTSPNLYVQGSTTSSATGSTKAVDQFRETALLVEESQLVGIAATKKKLVDWLSNDDPNLKVLAIVGMGGLGKTTLAKQIYNACAGKHKHDADGVKNRFTKLAFVTISLSLKEDELLIDMIQQLFPGEWTETQQLSIHILKEKFKERLRKETYLIVLDDVWRTDHWDQLELLLPRNNRASRVVITTRIATVAKYASREFKGKVHALQPLSESDSWALFCKKTFPTQGCPSSLEPICLEIIKKCRGVPLAILAIGGVLATKDEHRIEEWERVQRSLNVELQENPHLQMMNQVLWLSFHDLPDHLKPCYMFLSVFPENCPIKWGRVIRLWISEGFVEKKNGITLEEVAESYLYELLLLNRSLIQIDKMGDDGRVKSIRIHDFLREFALSKSREQRFVGVIDNGNAEEVKRARRLCIHNYDEIKSKSGLLSRLRSLFFFQAAADDASSSSSESELSKLPGDAFKFKLLTVLDLTGAPLHTFPEQISSKLLLLRYLSLRGTKISEIPKSIGNLKRLETLDLKDTYVTELPSEISMLQKLRHLLLYQITPSFGEDTMKIKSYTDYRCYCVQGFKVGAEIRSLLSLQALCSLDLETSQDNEVIKAVGRLTQLRRLSMLNLRHHHWRGLGSFISNMTNLRSLSLHTSASFRLQYMSFPPPLLQRLRLNGHIEELPSWMWCLHSLRVLHLVFTRLKKDTGACFGSLPNLTELVLWSAFHGVGTWMSVQPGSFPSLQTLTFDVITMPIEAPKDDKWKFVEDVMYRVRNVRMGRVPVGVMEKINLR